MSLNPVSQVLAKNSVSDIEKREKKVLEKKLGEERAKAKKEKEEAAKREQEMKSLFKAVPTQKVESGVDPKSIFCAFFKQNLCKKGDK